MNDHPPTMFVVFISTLQVFHLIASASPGARIHMGEEAWLNGFELEEFVPIWVCQEELGRVPTLIVPSPTFFS